MLPFAVFDYTGSLMVTHGYRNRSISDAEDGWRVWHLVNKNGLQYQLFTVLYLNMYSLNNMKKIHARPHL